MPQSTRKNRNDPNPPAIQPLDFSAAAGVSAFPTDHNDQFSMNNSGYAGFGNAFTNPFHASRTNTSHPQSSTFNTNPFGMSGFGMTGPYTNAYPSYGMTMGQNMKRAHSDNTNAHHTQHAHHPHNAHHDTSAFGAVTSFSSDPSISFISQSATSTNPYTQGAASTNPNHNNYDALSLSSTASRHKANAIATYDAFNNANPQTSSHSSSDLFGAARRHHNASATTDLSVLSYGTATVPAPNDTATHSHSHQHAATRNKSYKHNAFGSAVPHNVFGRYYSSNTNNNKSYTFDQNGNIIYTNNTNTAYKANTNTHKKASTASSAAHSNSKHRIKIINNKLNKRSASFKSKKKTKYDSSGFFPLQSSNLHKSSSNKLSSVTGVARLSLHHNPPVNGCSIEPYVILSCENGGFIQSDDRDCKYTWYKSPKRICFATACTKPAFLQCLSCSKLGIDHSSSYYCSTKCMLDCWAKHKDIHNVGENKNKKYDLSKWNHDELINNNITNQWKVKNAKECHAFVENPDNLYCKFPPPITNKWEKISNSSTTKRYKPSFDDIGRQLLLECAPSIKADKKSHKSDAAELLKTEHSKSDAQSLKLLSDIDNSDLLKKIVNECQDTSPCLPRPELSCHRSMRYYRSEHPPDQERRHGHAGSLSLNKQDFTFRVLSYNCLAPIYCTRTMYPYVDAFKLEWDYRKYNIKREILRYKPDIICLQEVQRNHFDEYFTQQLSGHGYEGMYRAKTRNGARGDGGKSVDGCAIFFKSERYRVSSRYHIDFNDTSSIYLDILRNKASESGKPMSDGQIKLMSKRLAKGNIALIVVLEEKERGKKDKKKDEKGDAKSGTAESEKKEEDHKTNNDKPQSINISDHVVNTMTSHTVKKQICIANTHVYWDPQFTDVKIWQAWILCEEISRALGRDLPLILCGDFNSEPKSAVYEYLTKGRVETATYEQLIKAYEINKRCVLPPRDNLRHRLGLKSHYNHNGKEPNYTNYTRDYKETLDYILYSSKSIESIAYLQELPERELCKEEAFPNSLNSSDHIPLMGTFAFSRDYQQWVTERRAQRHSHRHSNTTTHAQGHGHTHSHSHRSSSSHGHGRGHHSQHPSSSHARGHPHGHRTSSSNRSHSNTNNNQSGSGSGGIRPSAPPRHRQSPSPLQSRMNVPQPVGISKSTSHNALEILQQGSQSQGPGQNASVGSGRSANKIESGNNTNNEKINNEIVDTVQISDRIDNDDDDIGDINLHIDLFVMPHIDDNDIAVVESEVLGKEKRNEQITKVDSTLFNNNTNINNHQQYNKNPQMQYSQQTAYALYQQQIRDNMRYQLHQQTKAKLLERDDDFKCSPPNLQIQPNIMRGNDDAPKH